MTQKKIKASDVIGESYYIYTLTSTNHTPALNTNISITCTVTNIYGQTVSNKTITLYQNNTSKGEKTTSNDGTATWNNISMTSAGLQVFRVENSKITVLVDNKSETGHTHSEYLTSTDLSNYVTTDDTRLTNARTPLSHTHGNLQNTGQVGSTVQANKNVVTDSNGKITTEDKPTIPSASTSTPSADTTSGSYGSGTDYARANHTHPKSSIYAEATHTHSEYLTSHQDISGKIDTAGTGLSKTGTTLNHSNSVTALTTTSFKKVKYDSQGHITGTGDVTASDLPTHTHSQYLTEHQSLANYVTTDDSRLSDPRTPTSHTHTQSQITDFPTIPSASSTTPSADTTSGSVGTSTPWARSNHTHPKSSLYAESEHTHSQYQPTLVSGTNLKTINNTSLLGSGNISITAGSNVTVDSALSSTSENPVQNKIINTALGNKQDTLVSGTNIKTVNNTSLLGSGNVSINIPTASSTTPVADTTSGTAGTGTTWARADHAHPKSTIYADSSHAHGNLNNDGTITTTDSSTRFVNFIGVGDGSVLKKASKLQAGSVVDITEHSNIGSSANDTQATINTNIDTALSGKSDSTHTHGNLSNDGKVSTTSNDTFLYFAGIGNSTNSLYKAQYLRADKIKDINAYSNIGSSANDTQATINTNIDTALAGKSPTNHASTATTYGVATASNYGHTKVINNLTTSTNNNGEALSAYQGKVLNDNKANKSEVIDVNNIVFMDKTDDDTGAIILNFLT